MAFVNPPGWQPPVSQTKFFQPALIETTVPTQAIVLELGWYTQFSVPVIFPPPGQVVYSWPPQPPPNLPVTPSQLAFLVPFDLPKYAIPAIGNIVWEPQPPPALPITPTQLGFLVPFDTPKSATTGSGTIIWEPQPPPNLPVTPTQFGFYQPFDLPKSASTPPSVYAWSPQPISQVVILYTGWLVPFDTPKSLPTAASSTIWQAQPAPNLPVTPAQLSFYQPFGQPMPLPPQAQSQVIWIAFSGRVVPVFVIWIQEDDA